MRKRLFIPAVTLAFCTACSYLDNLEQASAPQEETRSPQDNAEADHEDSSAPSELIDKLEAPNEISNEAETTASEPQTVTIESLIQEPSYRILGPEPEPEPKKEPESKTTIGYVIYTNEPIGRPATALCKEIGAKLGSVDESDCLRQNLLASGANSIEGRDLAYKDYLPIAGKQPLGKVLIIGGIHGDEFSSVSVVFKWMDILNEHHSGMFHWRFIPASNPDGLLNEKSQRQNANGVDLNRNFPTKDWDLTARDHWIKNAFRKPRRFPGEKANSEPETQWLVEQIERFEPDVIVSMHAPYHLVDYDGPPSAPDQLGSLYLRKLGVFPGSLGNYAGVDLNIPIVTVELASAGIMPSRAEISDMWDDLVKWLRVKLDQ